MKGKENQRERSCTDSNEGLATELETPQEKNIVWIFHVKNLNLG